MKKLLSVAIAALMAFACAVSTYASTASTEQTVSGDVTSISIEKLPDVLSYPDYDMYLDAGIDENETNFEVILEALKTAVVTFDVELSGAKIVGHCADDSVVDINTDECTAKVVDPVKYVDIMNLDMDDEESLETYNALVYRPYTVEIDYNGAKAYYEVSVYEAEYDFGSEIYEFVSYNDTLKKEYVIEDDVYDSTYIDDDEEEIPCKTLDFDCEGITVTLLNKETGELETFDEYNIYIEYYFFEDENGEINVDPGTYYADAVVWTDDGMVPFDFEFKLVSNSTDRVDNTENADKDQTDASKTDKSPATTDALVTVDNTAIQTGDSIPAIVLTVIMFIACAAIVMGFYRKKIEE